MPVATSEIPKVFWEPLALEHDVYGGQTEVIDNGTNWVAVAPAGLPFDSDTTETMRWLYPERNWQELQTWNQRLMLQSIEAQQGKEG